MPVLARDIMTRKIDTATASMPIDDLCEIFQTKNIKGLPVVDSGGRLQGIVTESDVVFGGLGRGGTSAASPAEGRIPGPGPTTVGEIMTEPAISAEEETPVEKIAEIMWRMRIHRVPICRNGRLTGIISTLDICQAVAEGRLSASAATPPKPRKRTRR
jgi:CBS domain-containing protein